MVALTRSSFEKMTEDDLRKKVLIPLFEAMGYKDVFEYHGGVLEQGKDIVMWKEFDFGKRVNYAVVAKAKRISGKASGSGSAGEAVTQVRQALGSPFKDKVSGEDQNVHQCFVACPKITKEALTSMRSALDDHHLRATTFLHGEGLWTAVEEHLPEKTVMSKLEEVREVLKPHRVKAEIDDSIVLTLKEDDSPDAQPLHLGCKFEFPDTPEGHDVRESFEKAMSTGSPTTIPQEFVKELRLPDEMKTVASFFGFEDGDSPIIKMTSRVPDQASFPLRMEVWKDGELTGSYEYADLRAKQVGRDELTLTNEQQAVPLVLQVVVSRADLQAIHTWKINIDGANVHEVLHAFKFHNAAVAGGTLRILHVQTGFQIAERVLSPNERGLDGLSPGWLEVLEELDFIQQEIRIPIQLPNRDITPDEASEILETAQIMRDGKLEIQSKGTGWTISMEKQHVGEFFASYPAGEPRAMVMQQIEEREILGVRFEMGKRIVSCASAYAPKTEAKRVQTAMRKLADTDMVEIGFKPYDECPVIVEYPKWLPEGQQPSHVLKDPEEQQQLPEGGDADRDADE